MVSVVVLVEVEVEVVVVVMLRQRQQNKQKTLLQPTSVSVTLTKNQARSCRRRLSGKKDMFMRWVSQPSERQISCSRTHLIVKRP